MRRDLAIGFGVRYENQTNIGSHFDFAPRIGVIWSPGANQETKSILRSLPRFSFGFGVFYERVSEQLSLEEKRSGSRFQVIEEDPEILDSYPNVPSLGSPVEALPSRIRRTLADNIKSPYQRLISLTAEKRMPYAITLSATYGYSRTNRALRFRNINAPLSGTFNPQNPRSAVFPFGVENGRIYQTESTGTATNQSLTIGARFSKLRLANLQIFYALRKKSDDLVSASGSSIDAHDFGSEFAASNDDFRNMITVIVVSELPFRIRLTNLMGFSSGTPFNVTTGLDTNGDGFFSERPSFGNTLFGNNIVDTPLGVFDLNPSQSDVLVPRNSFRGPSMFTLDTNLDKTFEMGKANKSGSSRFSLTMNITANNILNTVNRNNPIGNISSPSFLTSNSLQTRRGALIRTPAPRRITFFIGFSF